MEKKIVLLFREKIYSEVLEMAKELVERLKAKAEIYLFNLEEEDKLRKELARLGFKAEVKQGEEIEEILQKEKPYLVLLPKPEISPIVHAFKKPWSEKIAEDYEGYNFLLVQEGIFKVKKALLYVDRDSSSENYIKESYNFLKTWGVDFEFATVFDERYFAFLIKKEHPEGEARELLGKMFEDYINAVRERIKRVLKLQEVEILPLKGEVGKTLPYFAKRHGYDLVVISHAYDTKDELIENSETCVAVFKN